jgi:hypothetical protein
MPKAKTSNNTPASPRLIRALTLFETLPPGYKIFRIVDDASAPHLVEGEFAVIDSIDREPQHGELFLIQWDWGPRRRGIVQLRTEIVSFLDGPAPAWWVSQLAGFRRVGSCSGVPLMQGLSDGPYRAGHLRSKLLGRVVGFAVNSLGEVIAPEAGWEDEDAGNDEFDPLEYLDVMIGAGYEPSVFRRPDGTFGYREMFPEDLLSEAQRAECDAVRAKCSAASFGIDRIKEECLRRGLVD